METYDNTPTSGPKLMDKDNLKIFYREQLPALVKTVFLKLTVFTGIFMLLVCFVLIRMFVGNLDIFDLLDPGSLLAKLRYTLLFGLYVFLFMVNIFQQSLKASGTNDAIAWYISPLAILLVFYCWVKIASGFLMPTLGNDMVPF